MADLSMRDRGELDWWKKKRSRSDYNDPGTLHLGNRYTTSNGCRDLAMRQPATRAPILQVIKELARTREQVLNY
jgi:hypothetical protein